MLAKAFDIPAERIERADEVDAALNRLLNSRNRLFTTSMHSTGGMRMAISSTGCV